MAHKVAIIMDPGRTRYTDMESVSTRQRITIASDGGLKHQMGTQGCKIVSRQGYPLFSGSGPVDGPFDIVIRHDQNLVA
jgi:hypothetical protein